MTLETRIREHLSAKAATIPADPPPVPAAHRPAPRRWQPAVAVAAAVVVALAVGAAAWLFRATETVAPVAPDLEELTPTLQDSLLDWARAGGVEPGVLAGMMAVDGDVVLFGAPLPGDAARFPLRIWRWAPGEPPAEVEIDLDAFRSLDSVTRVVWDGRRFHAFGGRYNANPAHSAGSIVESLAWTSTDGRSWERHQLLDPAAGGSPYLARTAVVVDAAASEHGVVVAAVASDTVDWEAYLRDRLGDGYAPGSLFSIDVDGTEGAYRLFDTDNRLLAEVAHREIGADPSRPDFETVVLYSADGRSYAPVAAIPPDTPAGGLTVQAGAAGLFVLGTGGPAEPHAWFSPDGESWAEVGTVVDGQSLEAVRSGPWRGLLLAAVSGLDHRTVAASADGVTWLPVSPPLEGPSGLPLPTDGIVAGDAGIFVHGFQIRLGSGPLEVLVRADGFLVFSYPQEQRIIVTPDDSSEAALVATFAERGPSGLPLGFEPGPGGTVRALDPGTGEVLLELSAAEWADLTVAADPDAALARGWFTPDGEAWGSEDLAGAFGGPGLVHAAAVTGDAVVVLFEPDPPAGVLRPMPGAALQVWVGRPG